MTRRLISTVAAVAGLIAIVLAVCSATVWRPSATVTATLASRPDQPYVLVEPGVLGLVDSDVTVEAQAGGQTVTLAVGYSHDARSWLADDPYVSVTGLQSWSTLAGQVVTERCPQEETASTAASTALPSASAESSESAESTESAASAGSTESTDAGADASDSQDDGETGCTELTASGADPAGGDVWQLTARGEGEASLTLDAADPDLVLLAAAGGSEPAPQLTLTWPRRVSTPWLIPGLVVGGVLVCLGVFGLLMDLQIRHADAQRRRRAAERAARLATADSVATLGIPALSDPNRPLTRRERREKERAEAAGEQWVDPRTGRPSAQGTPVPDVPQAPTDSQEPEDHRTPEDASAPAGEDEQAEDTQDAATHGVSEPATPADGSAPSDDVAPSDDAATLVGEPDAPLPVSADSLSDTQQIEPVRDPAGGAPESGPEPVDSPEPEPEAASPTEPDHDAEAAPQPDSKDVSQDATAPHDPDQAAAPAQAPAETTDEDHKEQQ